MSAVGAQLLLTYFNTTYFAIRQYSPSTYILISPFITQVLRNPAQNPQLEALRKPSVTLPYRACTMSRFISKHWILAM